MSPLLYVVIGLIGGGLIAAVIVLLTQGGNCWIVSGRRLTKSLH